MDILGMHILWEDLCFDTIMALVIIAIMVPIAYMDGCTLKETKNKEEPVLAAAATIIEAAGFLAIVICLLIVELACWIRDS
ncbi:MAG: hypothetical protein LBC20_02905 [Planctomycetaceae bacterium]|jgi:hypothetical protein|nr:hypothetical protein [Planctomycetaceae bacterium]